MTGKDTGDAAQTLGNVTVNSGGGDFRVNPNNGTSTTVTTSASGGSLIIGQALGSGTGTLAITTTTDKDATGIYGGRVVFANGIVNTGCDWATTATEAPGPFVLSAYTGYTALDLTAGTDTVNSLVTASATMTGSRTTHSLKFAPTATGQTLALGTSNTLTLTSGGLLMTSGQSNMNITDGSITANNGTQAATINVGVIYTIPGVINSNSVTKAGTSHWVLSGDNTYTTGFTALPGVTNTGGILCITWTKAGTYGGNYGTDFVVETSATLDNPWVAETLGVNVIITGDIVTYTFPAGTRNFARLNPTSAVRFSKWRFSTL
jgi:autotransporter-associated beta strand protein